MKMPKRVTQPSSPTRSGLLPFPNSTADLPIEQRADGSNADGDMLPIVDSAAPTLSEQADTQRETVTRADHAFSLADRAIADEVARHTGEAMDYSTSHACPGARQRRRVRIGAEVFDRIAAIGRREKVSTSTLIERMLTTWERQRLEDAEAISRRRAGADNDTHIARDSR